MKHHVQKMQSLMKANSKFPIMEDNQTDEEAEASSRIYHERMADIKERRDEANKGHYRQIVPAIKPTEKKEIQIANAPTHTGRIRLKTAHKAAGSGVRAALEGKRREAEAKGAYNEQKFDPNPVLFGKRAGNYHDFLKTQAGNIQSNARRALDSLVRRADSNNIPFSNQKAANLILDDALDFAYRGKEDPEWDQAVEQDKQRKKKFGYNDHAYKLQLAKKRGDSETHKYLLDSVAENKKEKEQQGKNLGVTEVGPVSRFKRDPSPIEEGLTTPVELSGPTKGQHHALSDAIGLAFSNAGAGRYTQSHVNALKAIGDHLDEVGDLKGRIPNYSQDTLDFVNTKYPNFGARAALARHEDNEPMFLSNSEAGLLESLLKVKEGSPKVQRTINMLTAKAAGQYMKAESSLDDSMKSKIFSKPASPAKPAPHEFDVWAKSLLGGTKGQGPGLVKRGVDAAVKTSPDKTLHGVKQHILDTMVKNGHDKQDAIKAIAVMDPFIKAALGQTMGKSAELPLEKGSHKEGSAGMTGGKFDKRQYVGSSSSEVTDQAAQQNLPPRQSKKKTEVTYIAQPPMPGQKADPLPKNYQPIKPNAPRPSEQDLATAKEDFERQKALKQAETSSVKTLDNLRQAYLRKFQGSSQTKAPVARYKPEESSTPADFTTGVSSRTSGSGEGIVHDIQSGMNEDALLAQVFGKYDKKPEAISDSHQFGSVPGRPNPTHKVQFVKTNKSEDLPEDLEKGRKLKSVLKPIKKSPKAHVEAMANIHRKPEAPSQIEIFKANAKDVLARYDRAKQGLPQLKP